MIGSCSAAELAIISIKYKMDITNAHHVLALTVNNGIYTWTLGLIASKLVFGVSNQILSKLAGSP